MAFSNLNQIPWHRLRHAYGTAEDVPRLLLALQTEPLGVDGDDSALYQLFGNIWHQGTVYEATSCAVPFLLELAADPDVPKRKGVVELLGAIANGSSYLDVHEDILSDFGVADKNLPEHEKSKAQELQWVADAKQEVAKGIDLFVDLSKQESDIRLAAAEVLSFLTHVNLSKQRLLEMLDKESEPNAIASLLLLLSRANIEPAEEAVFSDRLFAKEAIVRRAATMACLQTEYGLDSNLVREQMVEAILDADFEMRIENLPIEFDLFSYLPEFCLEKMDEVQRHEIFETLCLRLDQKTVDTHQAEMLLGLAFPNQEEDNDVSQISYSNISDHQREVLKGLLVAIEEEKVTIQSPWRWGLPEYRRDWKNLIEGLPPVKVNQTLPLLGCEDNPSFVVQLRKLEIGDRVHHRAFGFGSIESLERDPMGTRMSIEFDEEGWHSFHFSQHMLMPESFAKRLFRWITRPFG